MAAKTSGARSGSGAMSPSGRHTNNRSRVTNGRQLFLSPSIDMRTQTGRRWKDLVELTACDLGGPDQLTELQKQLIRRASSLAVACEAMEADLVRELPVDLAVYGQLSDRLRRICETLGTQRVAKPANPLTDLGAIAAHIASQKDPTNG